MPEEPGKYHTGRTARIEPPLTVDMLVAKAHANRQGISYETGEQLLSRLPGRLHALRNVSIILRHGESTISVDRESRWGSTAGSPQAWIGGEG